MLHRTCTREKTLAVEAFVRTRSCDRRSELSPIVASLVATRGHAASLLVRAFDKHRCAPIRAEPFRVLCSVNQAIACSGRPDCLSCKRVLRSRNSFATRQLAPLSFGGVRHHQTTPLRLRPQDRLEGHRRATARLHDTYLETKNAPGDSSSGGE